jgi:hypothetical protein
VRTYRQFADALRHDLALAPERATTAQYQETLERRQSSLAGRSNLPAPLTSFLGREAALADLALLLADPAAPARDRPDRRRTPRLVTIAGAGGCGKTRLAIERGAEMHQRYAGGVWLVALAALPPTQHPDLQPLLQQVAGAIYLAPQPDHSLFNALREALAARRTLLILDNCEHIRAWSRRISP